MVFVSVLLLAASCSEETTLVSTDETPLPTLTLKSGLMHFRDAESLRSELEKISQMDSSDYASWKASFSGFVSLQDRYNQLLEQALEDETVLEVDLEQLVREHNLPYCEGLSYTKVLSENGLVVIANKLHAIREGKEFVMDFSQANLAKARNGSDNQLADLSHFTYEVRDQLEDNRKIWIGSSLDKVTPYPQNTNLSAHLRVWSYQFTTHVEVGGSITGRKYKKRCGTCSWKWQNDDMWYAGVEARFAYWLNGSLNTHYLFNPVFEDDAHEEIVINTTVLDAASLLEEITVVYSYEDDGYPRVQMTISKS